MPNSEDILLDGELYSPRSGKVIKDDGSVLNEADILEAVYDAVNNRLKVTVDGVTIENSQFTVAIDPTEDGIGIYGEDSGGTRRIALVKSDGTVKVDSDALNAVLGAAGDTKVTDPDAASATVAALLRGILEAANAINANTDQLEGYTDQLEGYVDQLEGYVDQLEGYVDELETKLAGGLPAELTAGGNLKTAVQEKLPAGDNKIGAADANLQVGDADVADGNPVPAKSASNAQAISRTGVSAADGAQVESTAVDVRGQALYAEFEYSTTGSPTTVEVRGAVEVSVDGTNWHEVIRFADKTDTAGVTQVGRIGLGGAGGVVDLAGSNLNSAAASGSVKDGPIPVKARLVSKVEALSGGTSPTVDLALRLVPS